MMWSDGAAAVRKFCYRHCQNSGRLVRMKKITALLTALLLLSVVVWSQDTSIPFKLKNNSWKPRKYILISYEQNASWNNTQTFFLLPGTSKHLRFPVGTRLYLATQQQVNTVMGGGRLETAPWHVVAATDNKAILPLH